MKKEVYWVHKEGNIVKGEVLLASTELDGDMSDEELIGRAKKEAISSGLDLSYGELILYEISEDE